MIAALHILYVWDGGIELKRTHVSHMQPMAMFVVTFLLYFLCRLSQPDVCNWQSSTCNVHGDVAIVAASLAQAATIWMRKIGIKHVQTILWLRMALLHWHVAHGIDEPQQGSLLEVVSPSSCVFKWWMSFIYTKWYALCKIYTPNQIIWVCMCVNVIQVLCLLWCRVVGAQSNGSHVW